jgi:hypothetical protein
MNQTQQVLRATNKEIRRVIADVGAEDSDFLCECGAKDCGEVVTLTGEEFDTFLATANGTPLVIRDHR